MIERMALSILLNSLYLLVLHQVQLHLSKNEHVLRMNYQSVYHHYHSQYHLSKDWYEENKLVSECLDSSLSAVGGNNQLKSTTKQLINLYKQSGDSKYDKDLEEAQQKLDQYDIEDFTRKKLNKYLESLDKEKYIQDCI